MNINSAGRRLNSITAAVATVAVVTGSLWNEPPQAGSSTVRTAAIAVELRAAAVETALAGAAVGESAPLADAAGVEEPVSASPDPVAVIENVANLVVSLAGAALWLAAFPITLPATMIGGSWLYAVAGYFGCFCFRFPAPDVVAAEGLRAFFEIPAFAVQTAIARFQPGQSVTPAAMAGAAADVGTQPSSAGPDAPAPAAGDGAGGRPGASDMWELSASPAGSNDPVAGEPPVKPLRPQRNRMGDRPATGTRLPSATQVLPAQSSASPSVSAGKPTATAGSVSRAPRRVPAGRR